MDFGHYTTQGATLAVALVNALHTDDLRDRLEAMPATTEWNATTADRLRSTARHLREVFATDDDVTATTTLNALLSTLPIVPHLSTHDGKPAHLHYAPDDADAVTRIACNAAMAVTAIISEHGVARFRLCAAPSCGTAFVDTSRNGQRRFCSPTCANRTHVAAHRQRTANQPDTTR